MTDSFSTGWGLDPLGEDWWGSVFHWFGPEDETVVHVSQNIERPPVPPRARF